MNLRKILVVEDSKLVHKMYDVALARYQARGTAILHVRDGAQALALLEEHPDTDVVLLDLNMPVMGGLEFLRVRREREGLWTLYVFVVTTRGEEQDVADALAAGATGVITKPLDPEVLHAQIGKYFSFSPP